MMVSVSSAERLSAAVPSLPSEAMWEAASIRWTTTSASDAPPQAEANHGPVQTAARL
jgi:hypothetical protein